MDRQATVTIIRNHTHNDVNRRGFYKKSLMCEKERDTFSQHLQTGLTTTFLKLPVINILQH